MKKQFDVEKFSKLLWGDIYYDESTRKFTKSSQGGKPRAFSHFILEPFYKLVGSTLSLEKKELIVLTKKLQIYLNKKDYSMDIKPLLKLILGKKLGDISCIVDAMVSNIDNAEMGTGKKIEQHYTGDQTSDLAVTLKSCNSKIPSARSKTPKRQDAGKIRHCIIISDAILC